MNERDSLHPRMTGQERNSSSAGQWVVSGSCGWHSSTRAKVTPDHVVTGPYITRASCSAIIVKDYTASNGHLSYDFEIMFNLKDTVVR